MTLAKRIAAIARKEIGVTEIAGTNCGPRVNEYKAATSLPPGKPWPWCAAFVCWVVRQAVGDESVPFKLPRTAGAWDFENWAARNPGVRLKRGPSQTDIAVGDIVVFTFSHIGIAVSQGDSPHVLTVEGNTDSEGSREGGGVFLKHRHISKIRSRIRLGVPIEFTPTDFVPLAEWCKANKKRLADVWVPSRFYDPKTETTFASLIELEALVK
jgi:hypothetical protein